MMPRPLTVLLNQSKRYLFFKINFINDHHFLKKPIHGAGHFEKIPRKAETFVWVPNDKPSGIEGSFVVPAWEAKGLSSPEEQRENDIQNVSNNRE